MLRLSSADSLPRVHGVGVSLAKRAPDRIAPIAPDLFARVRAIGLDSIRLPVFWEAIEPAPGRYSERYLRVLRRQVEAARSAGLHVVVDMHQDVFGEAFGFAGFPAWACDPRHSRACRPRSTWFLSYLEPGVMAAFDRLWSDRGLIDALARAWTCLAETLRGAGVLGYELLNEPFWGSRTPAELERDVLPGVYARLIDAVRAGDPDPLVFLQPTPWCNLGFSTALVRPDRDRLVYAPHFYPPAVEIGLGYGGDRDALARHLDTVVANAARLRMPCVIGEVGVRRDVPGAEHYLEDVYTLLRERALGAFYWDLGPGGAYGLLDEHGRVRHEAVLPPGPAAGHA